MIRMGLPFRTSKFIVSRARSAVRETSKANKISAGSRPIEEETPQNIWTLSAGNHLREVRLGYEYTTWRVPTLTVSRLLEVDIGVAQRAPSNHVTTDTDGKHGSSSRKLLKQSSLRNVGVQVPDIQRGHLIILAARIHLAVKSSITLPNLINEC